MTIWNALAAGGALWCALMTVTVFVSHATRPIDGLEVDGIRLGLSLLFSLSFGLCLWGAIP